MGAIIHGGGRTTSFETAVMDMAAQGINVAEIGRASGLQRMAVSRIKTDPASAERMLQTWGE